MRSFPFGAVRLLLAATLLCVAIACQRKASVSPETGAVEPSTLPESTTDATSAPTPRLHPKLRNAAKPGVRLVVPAEPWNEFSGEKAMVEVAKQVALGPRPAGSAELQQARELVTTSLEEYGWAVEPQPFTGETPRGSIKFVNLIARWAGPDGRAASTSTQRVIVCSHYDTKRFSTIRFVGASDAASSTGALVELARVLAMDPALAAQVELVFFDGEEALQQFTDTDGLYGSRHYASTLSASGRARQFKLAILWDMIGDKDLSITLPPDSPAVLARGIFDAAESLHLRQHFAYLNRSLLDDHVPLQAHGIPSIDLIDFDYFPWHTADDTLDKLSPDSLHKVGAVTLRYLKTVLAQ